MSRILNIGTLLGGLGGAGACVVAMLQFAEPIKIETPQDLISALGKIEVAIVDLRFSPDVSVVKELESAVDSFSTQVALTTRDTEGELLFVPRSFSGLRQYKAREVFDFIAPNGQSKLILVGVSNMDFSFKVDGAGVPLRARLGDHFMINFGDVDCKFENVGFVTYKTADVRVSCS